MLTSLGQSLLDTWQTLPRRGGGQLPYWQDIKAEHLAPIMRHTWVLEYGAPFSMYIRFMGTEVARLGGKDTTGDDFLNTRIPVDQRSYIMAIYDRCYRERCGVALTRIVSPLGCNTKQLCTTFLPLAHEVRDSWMLLGCSIMKSTDTSFNLDDSGTADYGTTRMWPPYFFDIGFGIPGLGDLKSRSA